MQSRMGKKGRENATVEDTSSAFPTFSTLTFVHCFVFSFSSIDSESDFSARLDVDRWSAGWPWRDVDLCE